MMRKLVLDWWVVWNKREEIIKELHNHIPNSISLYEDIQFEKRKFQVRNKAVIVSPFPA